jgi:hypothetical protein
VRLDTMGAPEGELRDLNRTELNPGVEGEESVRRHGRWLRRTPAFSKRTDELLVVRSSRGH